MVKELENQTMAGRTSFWFGIPWENCILVKLFFCNKVEDVSSWTTVTMQY